MSRTFPDNSSPITTPAQPAHNRLACVACQRKKIKCDRTFPCGQCTKSSLTCVPSSRKQRMKAAKRAVDGELRNRIAKLESLVESLSGESPALEKPQSPDTARSTPSRTNSVDVESPGVRYVASSFWSSLTSEVTAIREALEEEDIDEATPETNEPQISPAAPQNDVYQPLEHDLIVCPPGKIYIMPGVLQEPEPILNQYLIEVFFKNVEPMLKVFHRPSLRAAVEHDADYLGHPPGTFQHDSLKRLIWFAAFNTLPEEEVLALTGSPKIDIVKKYRRFVGITVSQLDLMNTGDLATLQVLSVFITVCRSHDSSRRTWTSLSLLVRNAQAVYLNQDDPNAPPYRRELRKRLWHYIRLLDKFCSLDRGSNQLIRAEDFSIPFPTNTNDDLWGPDSSSIPELTDRVTDMTFAIMCFESCDTIEALLVPEVKATGLTWSARRQLALDMGKELERKYLRLCDLSNPFHRFQHAIGKSISTAMIVRAVRPMQRHLSSIPPPVDSPEVLQMAIDNLEAAYVIFADPAFDGWKWMRWVPWHCLAVALAGLCSLRGTPETVKAWALVEPAYKWCGQYIADSEDGMLWRPLTKLYKKATAYRDAGPAWDQERKNAKPEVSLPDAILATTSPNAVNATASWSQPWGSISNTFAGQPAPSLDLSNSNGMEYLSSNLGAMSPFTYPTTTAPFNDSSLTADMAAFNDPSWGDWGMMVTDFQNPLAGDTNMQNDIPAGSDWTFNNAMNQ